jgi:glycosyltransferase involved in cell wall biosynthesis
MRHYPTECAYGYCRPCHRETTLTGTRSQHSRRITSRALSAPLRLREHHYCPPFGHSIDRTMKIGVIAHLKHAIRQPFAGGLEMHTWLLCHELRKRGHTVTLFAALGTDMACAQSVCSPTQGAADSFSTEHRVYGDLMNELKNSDFDIIHNNSLHYLPVAMASMLPMPMVTTLHTPPFWEMEGALRLSHPANHHVVAVSAEIQRSWQRITGVERVVANGIDLRRFAFHPHEDSPSHAIWLGRIVPEKGLEFAIDAARWAGIPLRIAGPIADPNYFRRVIEPRLHAGTQYMGHLSHTRLARAIGRARVSLCTPMWEEPFGLVVAEALACGTPVAAFARGAIPDLLDSTCGALATPGDATALGRAVLVAQRLDRRACRARAECVGDAGTMLDGYEALYRDCVTGNPHTSKRTFGITDVASIAPTNDSLVGLYARHGESMVCALPAPGVPCPA